MIKFEFPRNFVWGCATASNQIEGAVDVDGKTPSIWDANMRDHAALFWNGHDFNTTIADFYYHFREDIENMRDLGLKSFRFSLSWTRILPDGRGAVNAKGVDFYNRVIDTLLANGIEPFVDLYHWDLPESLGKEGSFLNSRIVEDFGNYAEICFKLFGDRVRYWSTINEPSAMGCFTALDPRFNFQDPQCYFTYARNVLKMHNTAVRIFRSSIPAGRAEIGAVSAFVPIYPKTFEARDVLAARVQEDYVCNVWFSGILKGKYPELLLTHPGLDCDCRAELQQELSESHQPVDYMGVNYYYPNTIGYREDSFLNSELAQVYYAQSDYGFTIYPQGLFDTLMYFKREYGNPKVFLTENGFATDSVKHGDDLDDRDRIDYLREHFRELSRALVAGANVRGYFLWSIVDTFECHNGLRYQFGLNHVDLNTKKRTKRKSWYYYQNCIKNNQTV